MRIKSVNPSIYISVETHTVDGVTIEVFENITPYVVDYKVDSMKRFVLLKDEAENITLRQARRSVIETNGKGFSTPIWDDKRLYAFIVDCVNKPAPIGTVEWVELC